MQTKKATNIDELIEQVTDIIALTRDDPRRGVQCEQICNGAGKVINALKAQYEYAKVRKVVPELNIPFLNSCIKTDK